MLEIKSNTTSDYDHRKAWLRTMEQLQMRLALLKKEDRLLPRLYFYKGLSYRDLSQLFGLEERTVARRIKQITDRLMSDKYITVLRHKSQFSEIELEVAYDRYLLGLSYRKISDRHNLGGRPALGIIRKLDGWLRKKLKD